MKKAVIFIKGGFGNQLFQIAYAIYLKQKKYKVIVNTSFLKNDGYSTPRHMILSPEFFELKKQNKLESYLFIFFYRLNRSHKFNLFQNFLSEYKFTVDSEKNDTLNNKTIFFNGYWKDLKYIEPIKENLISLLKKDSYLNYGFNNKKNKQHAMIHVRRGDFLRENRQLNINYYERSIDILNSKGITTYDVFTDDPEWVKSQVVFKNVNKIFAQISGQDIEFVKKGINSTDDKEETIKTFGEMLSYQNFVIGNSSYSFWAAYLGSSRDSVVTIADPMFRDEQRKNIYLDRWYLIPNT